MDSTKMDPTLKDVLAERLLGMADDELLLGHRNSEWTGHAPILEEDIAIANLAQDELGHAMLWYEGYRQLTGVDPDDLVFRRHPEAFRNCQLVELPRGDWAFTLMRQYLFDTAERIWLPELAGCQYEPLAMAAAKIEREELYHHRHSSAWVRRLALGTDESHHRIQQALTALWPFALQLFVSQPGDALLFGAGLYPELEPMREQWEASARPFLIAGELEIPTSDEPAAKARAEHSLHLRALLDEMQSVARSDPEATW